MTSLAEALRAGPPSRWQGCSIGRYISTLDTGDRAALESALGKEDEWSANRLATVLTATGFATTGQTVNRHRRGRCSCRR